MSSNFTLITLDSVSPEPVEWLWEGRIPAGKLVVIEGDPGTGKSSLTLDLAARLSTGADWPDGAPSTAEEVLLMSAEDGLADTIVPRLKAASADLSMVHALAEVSIRGKGGRTEMLPPSIPRDTAVIAEAIRRYDARLVVVDPLNAFLGREIDSYKDQDVRRALMPLAKLAEETGCTFILVRHLNKANGTKAMYRGHGSTGIGAASRAQYLVARDPSDLERRILAPIKFNLGQEPPALAYRLIDAPEFGSAKVAWSSGPVPLTADDLLSSESPSRATNNPAVGWLAKYLADGHKSSSDLLDEANEAGLSEGQVKRAKATLNVVSRKSSTANGGWISYLPEHVPDPQPRSKRNEEPRQEMSDNIDRDPEEDDEE